MEARTEAIAFEELDEAAGIFVGEWLNEGGIDKGEDGDAGGDAESEDEDCGDGEAGVLAELAKSKTQVLEDGLRAEGDHSVALFLEQRRISELADGCGVRGLRRETGGDQLALGLLAMKGHLLVKLAAEAVAAKQEPDLA